MNASIIKALRVALQCNCKAFHALDVSCDKCCALAELDAELARGQAVRAEAAEEKLARIQLLPAYIEGNDGMRLATPLEVDTCVTYLRREDLP